MAPRNSESSEDWQVHYPEIKMRSAHLLRSREWVDCTFEFQTGDAAGADCSVGAEDSKGSLAAHRLILAMASPVFAAMFYGAVGDKSDPVFISDIDLPTFSVLLEYIYTDEVSLSDTNQAASLYGAAHKYILVHLEKRCLDYLFQKLNSNNVCHIYEFSCLYGVDTLKNKCLELFSTKTEEVLKSPSFRNIQVETLKQIVSMESLNIESEMDLFNAVVDYVDNIESVGDQNQTDNYSQLNNNLVDDQQPPGNSKCNCMSREPIAVKRRLARENLPGIIEQIRFLSVTPADIVENSKIGKLLTQTEIFAVVANLASTKAGIPMPERFSTLREKRNVLFCENTTKDKVTATILTEQCSEATYRWLVNDFKSTDKPRYSPPFIVRGLPWRIKIEPFQENGKVKILSIYLNCQGPVNHLKWSCSAKAELMLIRHHFSRKPWSAELEETFKFGTQMGWGFKEFLEWKEVRNPVNGYIKDDTITIEVHIVADPPLYDEDVK